MSTADRDQANLPMDPLPIALRERVMAASLLARGVGETVPAVPAISADEAFERAADAFYRLLGTLSAQGWKTAALRGLDVQQLDRGPHHRRGFRRHHLVTGRPGWFRRGQPVVPFLPGHPAELAAQQVHGPVPGQHDQVGAQRACRGVIPVRMAPQLDEHFLHNVLRGAAVPQDPQRAAVHTRCQLVEDFGQSTVVSSRQSRRQQGVAPLHLSDASLGCRSPAMPHRHQAGARMVQA